MEVTYGSILHEMSVQKRDERCQGHYYEERQTGDTGRMSLMWNKDVPYRQRLEVLGFAWHNYPHYPESTYFSSILSIGLNL